MQRYAVVQETLDPIPFDTLREVLVSQGGMTRVDAGHLARNNNGIISELLSVDQAAKICGALRSLNFTVRVLPADKLPPRRKGHLTRRLQLQDDCLLIPYGVTEVLHRVPWASVFVISAGRVAETKERQVEVVKFDFGDDTAFPGAEFESERYSEFVHVTELLAVSDGGKMLHIRLPARGINYERTLGASPKGGFFAAYLTLLETLIAKCQWAVVSPQTLELLEHRRRNPETRTGDHHQFVEERRFVDYNRWLLQLAIMREQGSAS